MDKLRGLRLKGLSGLYWRHLLSVLSLKHQTRMGLVTVVVKCFNALFPDATPGIKSPTGSINTSSAYRPGLRLLVINFIDDVKSPLYAQFTERPRARQGNIEKSEFSLQLPEYIYGAALNAGATKKELCVVEQFSC